LPGFHGHEWEHHTRDLGELLRFEDLASDRLALWIALPLHIPTAGVLLVRTGRKQGTYPRQPSLPCGKRSAKRWPLNVSSPSAMVDVQSRVR
jgi:hypothetical protein